MPRRATVARERCTSSRLCRRPSTSACMIRWLRIPLFLAGGRMGAPFRLRLAASLDVGHHLSRNSDKPALSRRRRPDRRDPGSRNPGFWPWRTASIPSTSIMSSWSGSLPRQFDPIARREPRRRIGTSNAFIDGRALRTYRHAPEHGLQEEPGGRRRNQLCRPPSPFALKG